MSDTAAGQALIALQGAPDSDQEEVDALTLELRGLLLELDVDRVDLARADEIPAGAKAGGAIALGTLVVTFGIPAIRSILNTVNIWIQNRPVRSIVVSIGDHSIEVQAASAADQRSLIEAFVATHSQSEIEG